MPCPYAKGNLFGFLLPFPKRFPENALGGCSPVTNVVSGLGTPQSTISGSNYLYVVDPLSRKKDTAKPAKKARDRRRPDGEQAER